MSWHTMLVLGGLGSGRLEYAETLIAGTPAAGTLVASDGDREAGLRHLAGWLADGKPDQIRLVTDLTEWLPASATAEPPSAGEPSAGEPTAGEPTAGEPTEVAPSTGLAGAAELVQAVRTSPARLVLVSTETEPGLASPAAGRDRVLALGALHQALAETVDAVVLVVAGQPIWLKGGPGAGGSGGAPTRASTAPAPESAPAGDLAGLRSLPSPDEDARSAAGAYLASQGGYDLGALASVATFAAATQGTAQPRPWQRVRALVLVGDHAGDTAAGAPESATLAAQLRAGAGPLAQLAGSAGVNVQLVEVAAAAPIEAGPAMTEPAVEAALGYGWRLAGQAVDEGVDAIILGAAGAGAATAAVAVVVALAPNAEPAALLPRVRTADGKIDDQAWIARCAAVRDAVHRFRSAGRTAARTVLAELGGPDLATAAGIILGAAARRTPVLLDGPVGAAAALAARGLAAPARHWCLLVDHNRHPAAVRATEVLGLSPLLDLRLDIGEGAPACAALPLLRAALTLPG